MKRIAATEDKSRYMYVLLSEPVTFSTKKDDEEGGSNGGDNDRKYKRYKLSDAKTFDSLFFPEKDPLLRVLEHFKNKSGKYAIPGYPHKLGLLLHGMWRWW